jgi:hypothetical protein
MNIPFDPYDFFGYLASGLVVVVGMDLVIGFPHILGTDLKIVDGAVLLLAIYIAGQIIATPAKAIFEDLVVDKILQRPNVNLFREKKPVLRSLMFPGFYGLLPPDRQKRVLERARAAGAGTDGESLFLHVRYSEEIRTNEGLMARLNAFLNKYGFARNLCFATLAVGIAALVKAKLRSDPLLAKYGILSIVVALLLFYRYLKFFRQCSYEMFNTYAGK